MDGCGFFFIKSKSVNLTLSLIVVVIWEPWNVAKGRAKRWIATFTRKAERKRVCYNCRQSFSVATASPNFDDAIWRMVVPQRHSSSCRCKQGWILPSFNLLLVSWCMQGCIHQISHLWRMNCSRTKNFTSQNDGLFLVLPSKHLP